MQIYAKEIHNIDRKDIDRDAVKIIERLRNASHEAYIVGGAVRDLLLGKHPKDFDVVTDASPNRIRRLFRYSRIIGRRFKLVHIFFRNNKIIETSTYRAAESAHEKNKYGNISQDAWRRDFSVNALFYDPIAEKIYDYVNGMRDIKRRRLVPLIPLNTIFVEDAVRMLRAIKYSVFGELKMGKPLRRAIQKSVPLLAQCSDSRLTEELFKILLSGKSAPIFERLKKFNLIPHFQPILYETIMKNKTKNRWEKFIDNLAELDKSYLQQNRYVSRVHALAYYIQDHLQREGDESENGVIELSHIFRSVKKFVSPTKPPNMEIESAIEHNLQQLSLKKRGKFPRKKRNAYRSKPKPKPAP